MSTRNEKRNYQVFEDLNYSLVKYYRSSLQNRSERMVIKEVEKYAIKIVDATIGDFDDTRIPDLQMRKKN